MENRSSSPFHGIVLPLLSWYAQNARPLPWRENTDPYRVWVSEIMLQQTRVDTVIPYYQRFMQRFPAVRALADAPEETVFKLWEGLGYYSRARNLHRCAGVICREHGGLFPGNYEAILALPGIGPYSAGAIASIAFELPVPAVDGNVLRVCARLTGDGRAVTDAAFKRDITETLRAVYPAGHCGDFTQSLMELGALICTPGAAPDCPGCPLTHLCAAYREGRQAQLPVRPVKAERRKEQMTVFLLYNNGRLALRKRPDDGLLAGLWELPHAEGFLTPDAAHEFLEKSGLRPEKLTASVGKKHIFTHIEWHMRVYRADCAAAPDSFVWATPAMLTGELTLPTAFKKILAPAAF